jgi:hypothetical protein
MPAGAAARPDRVDQAFIQLERRLGLTASDASSPAPI